MSYLAIRPFRTHQLADILHLQHSLAPLRRHMTLATLEDCLTDLARKDGASVRLVFEGDSLLGCAAWVSGKGGEFFGSPFFAKTEDAAEALIRELFEHAKGQTWTRVAAFAHESPKVQALEKCGFTPSFEFLEYEVDPAGRQMPQLPLGITDHSLQEMDRSEFVKLSNLSFAGVDNSLPIDLRAADETLSSALLHESFSRVLRNLKGQPIAFSIGNPDGYIDSIGVLPVEQHKGLGTLLYRLALARAANDGLPRLFSTVSSRNESSIRLHSNLGIPVVERRTVWQKDV